VLAANGAEPIAFAQDESEKKLGPPAGVELSGTKIATDTGAAFPKASRNVNVTTEEHALARMVWAAVEISRLAGGPGLIVSDWDALLNPVAAAVAETPPAAVPRK
jgi:hypothetical protein